MINIENWPSAGDRVKWSYTHHLNSKSSTTITKRGWYEGLVNHRGGYRGLQLASVWFDGNKWNSTVPYEELVKIEAQPTDPRPAFVQA